jgi:CubicO group peptidase (beta-lactamase class C family)
MMSGRGPGRISPVLFLVLAFLFTGIGCGDTKENEALMKEREFNLQMEKLLKVYNIPSVSACIIKRDKKGIWNIAWEGAYGYRMALWPRIKANRNTIYPAGSITKIFTATAVMQLVEKGLIDLDRDVSEYLRFPVRNPGLDYNDPDNPVPPVTVRQLLSHRSGLNYPPLNFFLEHKKLGLLDFGVFKNTTELEAYLARKESWSHEVPGDPGKNIFYLPGEHYCYSNVGYLMLGFVIEEAVNRDKNPATPFISWSQYIRDVILSPLGMDLTNFYWINYPFLKRFNRAQGYIERPYIKVENLDHSTLALTAENKQDASMSGGILVPNEPPVRNSTIGFKYNAGGAAGQILSTARDLAVFFIVHLNNGAGYKRDKDGGIQYDNHGKPIPVKILSSESVRLMHDFGNSSLCPVARSSDPPARTGLFNITEYGLGWMRVNLGGRYWNYPWNPATHPSKEIDWQLLEKSGIIRNGTCTNSNDGGLNIEGHGGDLPGYHSGMFRVADDLAIVYLMNENFSEENHDESRMQPERFRHYTSRCDGVGYLVDVDGALPHNIVKFSEIEYLLMQMAASLR